MSALRTPGAEKYRTRLRHLYALEFAGRRVYIGQTVDPHRRAQQHQHAWSEPFTMTLLDSMRGTEAQAEEYEYAWRYIAHRAGFTVLARAPAGDPFVVRDPATRMTSGRYILARSRHWPRAGRSRTHRWAVTALAVAAVLAAMAIADHLGAIFHLLH